MNACIQHEQVRRAHKNHFMDSLFYQHIQTSRIFLWIEFHVWILEWMIVWRIIIIVYSDTGKIWALDVNKGRLRILMDAAKLHSLNDMIHDIHADLRLYAVSSHESLLLLIQKRKKWIIRRNFLLTLAQWKYFRNITSDY